MINRVDSKAGRIDVTRIGAERASSPSKADDSQPNARTGGVKSAAAEMVAQGPPVDTDKVAAIKAAIAEGRYPVDPIRIAEGMIALGFGPKS